MASHPQLHLLAQIGNCISASKNVFSLSDFTQLYEKCIFLRIILKMKISQYTKVRMKKICTNSHNLSFFILESLKSIIIFHFSNPLAQCNGDVRFEIPTYLK